MQTIQWPKKRLLYPQGVYVQIMADKKKVKQGKTSNAQGAAFELRVRKDLEDKGWTVDKWTNNVELRSDLEASDNFWGCKSVFNGKLVPAKPHMVFNPAIKRMIPLQRSSGFPDFIAYKIDSRYNDICYTYATEEETYGPVCLIGVEAKMTGVLDKAEKLKCQWYLRNNKFSKILIASKTKVKNKIVIVYEDFKDKYPKYCDTESVQKSNSQEKSLRGLTIVPPEDDDSVKESPDDSHIKKEDKSDES